jgi:membrane protein YdbS with pleckstrin-like domain
MESEYSNDIIKVEDLPVIEQEDIVRLDEKFIKVRTINSLGFYGLMSLCILAFGLVALPKQIMVFISLLIFPATLFLFNLWLIGKQFKVEGYLIRSKDIFFQQGFLWSKKMIIPFNRIQHASVHQGPLERHYKIGKLRIFTAGGQSSDLTIPGLSIEDAIKLKQLIADKTGTLKRKSND